MLLNAAQILAQRGARTVTVDVPEWGEGAQVLVGVIGGLAKARIIDWLDGIGRAPEPPEPAEDDTFSCDSPPPEQNAGRCDPGRVDRLELLLHQFIEGVRAEETPADLEETILAAEAVLETTAPGKVYTRAEEYGFTLRWCAEAILDPETKQPAFTLEQLEELGALDPAPLLRISAAAQELNLTDRASMRALEKNSVGTTAVASGSA